MTKPPIFIELCAGTAALSLRLQGGPKAKPPVSRMGAKTGYADAILAVLGLYPGQGAESYLWCEPDDGVRGLLMAYPQPEVLRQAAAILRGWKDEEPRALWERLRAELKAGASVEGADGVARWFTTAAWSFRRCEPESGYNAGVAEGMPQSATHHGGGALTVSDLAAQVLDVPPLPPTFIARDGRAVTPEEVAGWCVLGANAYRQGEPDSGYRDFAKAYAKGTRGPPPSNEALAGALVGVPPFPPVTIVSDGRVVKPEDARLLMNVRPKAALAHGADRDCLDPVSLGENAVALRRGSDVEHGGVVQFGFGMFDPDLRGPVGDLVRDILLLSAPLKIGGSVVCAGAVAVPDDLTGLTWAAERLTHQGAHPAMNSTSPGAEYEFAIAVLVDAADKWPSRVDRSNLAAFRDFVLGGFLNSSPFHDVTSCSPISYGGECSKLPEGVVCYIDAPYVGTTGYKHDLPRAEVVRMARLWADAGATVCISEAEPIPELMADGWHAVEISATRKGQKRTFSKQQAEWLTLSRAPSFVPRETLSLFGGAP